MKGSIEVESVVSKFCIPPAPAAAAAVAAAAAAAAAAEIDIWCGGRL